MGQKYDHLQCMACDDHPVFFSMSNFIAHKLKADREYGYQVLATL